jgi:hypothetical protein
MRTTTLHFFCDEANGEHGLAHDNAININTPFNAFWDARGIFHDVWEHYFEDSHKYFKDHYSFNIGGEIAAMGHFYYYVEDLNLSKRVYRNYGWQSEYISNIRRAVNGTNYDFIEAISTGCIQYGHELECGVPYQKKNICVEDLIHEHWKAIKDIEVETEYEDEKESAILYRRSVKLYKFQRLYRWGYRQAEKLVHNNLQNLDTLNRFYSAFEQITERNAEELSHEFEGIEFKIKGGNSTEWQAKFLTHDGTKVDYKNLMFR